MLGQSGLALRQSRMARKHQQKNLGLNLCSLVLHLNILGVFELVLFLVDPRWFSHAQFIDGGRWRRQSGESEINHSQTKITSTLDGAGHVFSDFFCCLGEQVVVAVG
jgi:hypothetical protein